MTTQTVISRDLAARFLYQGTFGPKSTDIDDLVTFGTEAWFDQQYNATRSEHRSKMLKFMKDSGNNYSENARLGTFWCNAIEGKDQLRQRMAYALSQIFVVSRHGGLSAENCAAYYDTLSTLAFSNFRELLKAVTLSPAMGRYLTLEGSRKSDPAKNTYPDENYAREVMQLFSIGLWDLKRNGDAKLNNGERIPSYTQDDVEELARVFTGWRRKDYYTPMYADESRHDSDEKKVFNEIFPAGQTAMQDLDQAIDLLFNHVNTPMYIAELLIKRLTLSNPKGSYVKRVAEVFKNNGQGIRGDLFAVLKAILLDSDLESGFAKNGPTVGRKYGFGKLKEPIVLMANLARALQMKSNDPNRWWDFLSSQSSFGQAPLRAPSVFNFYQADYAPSGMIADNNLTAPEFAILSSDVMRRIHNKLWDSIYSSRYTKSKQWHWNRADFERLHTNPTEYIALVNERFFGGLMSNQLADILNATLSKHQVTAIENRILDTLFVVISSPEFRCQE